MRTLVHAVETWRAPKLAGVAALSVFLPAAGTFFTPVEGDIALALVSTLALVGSGIGWRHRLAVASLPLELAAAAARGTCRGKSVFRFRVWLGRGRQMAVERAVVRYVRGAETHDFAPLVGGGHTVVGPLTLLISDADAVCEGGGRFEVDVQAREGDKRWAVSATYAEDDVAVGRFREGLELAGGLRLLPEGYGLIRE